MMPFENEERTTMFDIGLRNYLIKDYVEWDEYILNSEIRYTETNSISTLSTSVIWLKELDRQSALKEKLQVDNIKLKKMEEIEIPFDLMDKNEVKAHHIWIGDTGASCHMMICKDGFIKTWDIHGKTQGAHKSGINIVFQLEYITLPILLSYFFSVV